MLAGLNKTAKYTKVDCTPLEDQLLFYDGQDEDAPLMVRYCGGGLLPRVVSRSSHLLVVFKSSPYGVPLLTTQTPKPLHGFQLIVDVLFSDSDSLDFAKGTK